MNLFSSNRRFSLCLGIISGIVTIWALTQGFSIYCWLLALFGYFLYTCFGISISFHRLLAHRSFKTYYWVECLFSFFGAMAGTGSGISWVVAHRMHHKFADTELDPHSPHHQSFWRIITHQYNVQFDKWVVRDLLTKRFQIIMHEYYKLIVLGWWAVLACIDWRLSIFLGVIGMFLAISASSSVVIFDHLFGYRNFDTPDQSRNNWLSTVLVWGEGLHNNHHAFPNRWYLGTNWKEIDIGGLIIKLIKTESKLPMFSDKVASSKRRN